MELHSLLDFFVMAELNTDQEVRESTLGDIDRSDLIQVIE